MANVLIVDPDASTCALLELLLLRVGHRPIDRHELATGVEPDLVLVEPTSPPGVRLARELRERLPELPILCVSIDSPTEESRLLEPVAHLLKPFRRSRLEEALRQALPHGPEPLGATG